METTADPPHTHSCTLCIIDGASHVGSTASKVISIDKETMSRGSVDAGISQTTQRSVDPDQH
jgi:hypothetical protein